jgi:deoxyribodipyrimidine photo-lyase
MNTKSLEKSTINIVWIKRDIRSTDHAPLYFAETATIPFIIIFLFEPSLLAGKDSSLRHAQFQYHSVLDFNKRHSQHGKFIHILYQEANAIFEYLVDNYQVKNLLSYQESGTQFTWERDKWVQAFCKQHQIEWRQFQRDGIQRGIRHRKDWEKLWFQAITAKPIKNQFSNNCIQIELPFTIQEAFESQLKDYPNSFQPAGESYAWRYLQSFVEGRGFQYHKLISKPAESRKSCSRLSPYLAWGNLSIRQVYHFVKGHEAFASNKFAFEGMLTRLRWHCHFIQKFEMECSYETLCINKGYEVLERENNPEYLNAWKEGKTGFPLVDACMRCLIETGWINFRMRAMLVSVLCHHLDIDWRLGVYHLAQLFLDYEPGIHYPQFQMQAGTTGINTIRMYNPIKQSIEHDANGMFIKTWVSELRNAPENFIHEPWKMSELEQELYRVRMGLDYPLPLIDIEAAGRLARDKIWGHRKHALVQTENKRIVYKHTSIKNKMK